MRPLPFPLALLVSSLGLGACADPPDGGGPASDDDATAGDDDSSPGDDDAADDDAADDDTSPGDDEAVLLALAGEVHEAEIGATVQALQDLGTRHTVTEGDDAARAWIHDRLADLGLPSEDDPFTHEWVDSANVIARKEGAERPEVVWIFSAHYDSTSEAPDTAAPGADDNASGVAAVLEAARILAPLELRDSVWFVFTGAEEQGSLGSLHMVEWLAAQDVDLRGVIAPDMIGYWPLGDGDALDILGDEGSEHLVQDMATVADLLGVAHKTWIHHDYCYGDDHTHFQEGGFPAVSPMDCVEAHNLPASGEQTPHYHRATDTLDTLHLPFTARVASVLVATLAMWAGPLPDPVP